MKQIDQYLERYSERSSLLAAGLVGASSCDFENVLVVPMFDETEDFLDNFTQSLPQSNTLLILVLNYPDSAEQQPAALRTRAFGTSLKKKCREIQRCEHLHLLEAVHLTSPMTILLVDHTSRDNSLLAKQGVGLARKIGGDIALALIRQGLIAQPWIYFTDADATLPHDYFNSSQRQELTAAIHFNFKHTNPLGLSVSQRLYDLTLDYYVAGLKFAGSRYAHYSLGSALAVSAKHYAIVRGMPKRAAGEDFYLMNKLAKTGTIEFDEDITLSIQERRSERVPFGTGPATAKIEALEFPENDYPFYHPLCFEYLKHWLELSKTLSLLPQVFDANNEKNALVDRILQLPHGATLLSALHQLGAVDQLIDIVSHYKSKSQRTAQMTTNFDGLKTLRLIHLLRDLQFGECQAKMAQQWLTEHNEHLVRRAL